MTTPAKEWREEFDRQFIPQTKSAFPKLDDEMRDYGLKIKYFIEELLEKELTTHSAHLVERIEKAKITKETQGVAVETALGMQYRDGFNQALDKVKAIVKDNK